MLIVGAGAVGQVYGLALQRGGAEVSFYVKPKYAEEARAGFTLYALNGRDKTAPVRFTGFGVLSTIDEVRAASWDQVWLAVSGTAIFGDWVPEMLAATGDATVVGLQPGMSGRDRLEPFAHDRLVMGLIAFIAYQAPLPGETRFAEPGIAFWFPPSPSLFEGATARVQPVVQTLRAGGCPAAASANVSAQATFGSALLQSQVATLDAVGWRWDEARRGDHLALASRVWREAAAVGAHELGRRPPWWAGLVGPFAARAAMWAAKRLLPLDIETYLGYHFTKVGDQTRAMLDDWITRGRAAGLSVDALQTLRARMPAEARFEPRAPGV